MSTNVTAAIAAILSTAGLDSLNLTRDEPARRDTTAMPYAVMREGISTQPARGSSKDTPRITELAQLDLFHNRQVAPDDPSLMHRIRTALEAAAPLRLTGSDAAAVYRIRPEGSVRMYDRETQIVTESLTIRITRTA